MDLWTQVEAFFSFSETPMRCAIQGEQREFGCACQPWRFFPQIEQVLMASDQPAVYTVSPEHAAFALVRFDGNEVFIGPAPSVELEAENAMEALRYIGISDDLLKDFVQSVRPVPLRDIDRFRQMVGYFVLSTFGCQIRDWHYMDYPPPIRHSPVAYMQRPRQSLFDEDPSDSWIFGRKTMQAIMYGQVDQLEKQLSSMSQVFTPDWGGRNLTRELLYDRFIIALAEAATAAGIGGLGHPQCEKMTDDYLELLHRAKSMREIVQLMKMMLTDFAARTRQARMLVTDDLITVRICRDIEEHLHERLLPSEIADRLHISLQYLDLVFKKNSGRTVTQYIQERKVAESRYLLSLPGATVIGVSTALGFSSPNYFASVYRRVTGHSPGEWIRAHKQT